MSDKLIELRDTINACDAELFQLLVKRMGIAKEVAAHKTEIGKAVFDELREVALLEKIAGWAKEEGYSEEMTKDVWNSIMTLSRNIQEEEMKK